MSPRPPQTYLHHCLSTFPPPGTCTVHIYAVSSYPLGNIPTSFQLLALVPGHYIFRVIALSLPTRRANRPCLASSHRNPTFTETFITQVRFELLAIKRSHSLLGDADRRHWFLRFDRASFRLHGLLLSELRVYSLGGCLPSVRAMATKLGVHRNSMI